MRAFLLFFFTGLFVLYFNPAGAQKSQEKRLVLEGYTDHFSYFPGDSCVLFLSSNEKVVVSLRIFSIDRVTVDTLADIHVSPQLVTGKLPWKEGFGFSAVKKFRIPELKSGIYFIENTRIYFVVKSKKRSDLVILFPYNTAQAYCASGGKSLYDKISSGNVASPVLSFMRPLISDKEYSFTEGFLRWIKTTGYNYRFLADPDMDDYAEIAKSKILVVIGHSEYWTRKARQTFDKFIKSGNHAIVLSGNSMWWQIRYNKDKTQMVCYRDEKKDSIDHPLLKTVKWNAPLLHYPITKSIGCEFAGYGLKPDKGWNGLKIVTPKSPLLAGTRLKRGDIVPCPSVETDGAFVSGYDADSFPVLNPQSYGFKRMELVAFDRVSWTDKKGIHTFIVFQKTKRSGKVINVGSTDWCSMAVFQQEWIKKITSNAIDLLLADKNVFSDEKPRKINPRKEQVIQ